MIVNRMNSGTHISAGYRQWFLTRQLSGSTGCCSSYGSLAEFHLLVFSPFQVSLPHCSEQSCRLASRHQLCRAQSVSSDWPHPHLQTSAAAAAHDTLFGLPDWVAIPRSINKAEGSVCRNNEMESSLAVLELKDSLGHLKRTKPDSNRAENNIKELPFSLKMLKRRHSSRSSSQRGNGRHFSSISHNRQPDSLSTAVSWVTFVMNALHNHVFLLRTKLVVQPPLNDVYACADYQQMQDSLLWLFQHVFSHTPKLMTLTMVLLANFMVHSMAKNVALAPPLGLPSLVSLPSNATFPTVDTASLESKEAPLPNMDCEIKRIVASSIIRQLQPDDYACYDKTELSYQHEIRMDPTNPLLLLNYAQFLYLVRRDHNRADRLFRRALQADPLDSEAMNQFAGFLWIARGDLIAAEKAYEAAISANPTNPFYASCYAYFLWNSSIHRDEEEGSPSCQVLRQ